jgi:hypothetical protein
MQVDEGRRLLRAEASGGRRQFRGDFVAELCLGGVELS